MSRRFEITPGPLSDSFNRALATLNDIQFGQALWTRRLDVWTRDAATQEKIANRLGWLSAIDFVASHAPRLKALAADVRREGEPAKRITDVVLLGMGGSSLAPEVLRQVVGIAPGFPRFRMLDSVDPDAVRDAMANAATSLFVLASKSGSTIEPNVMTSEARRRILAAGEPHWGSRFIAITDENTELHRRAQQERFRDIFVNPSDIGGRYSALSFFGMVPAALMGADVETILSRAREMETACRHSAAADNPGLALGAFMAAGALSGRDKLTLLLPDHLKSFGLWVEQLVAESTGKHGKGVVPITGEAPDAPIGSDRAIVSVTLANDRGDHRPRHDAGTPHARIEMADVTSIGAEFLRWEIATATAGVLMEINPFDEPNVQQAKDATRTLLASYQSSGRLPVPQAQQTIEGTDLTLSAAAMNALGDSPADRFVTVLRPGDYFGLLAYLPPDREPWDSALREFRSAVGTRTGCATMFGYGPRYLHSTGQLHKGGANNGVFLIVTAAVDEDLPIADQPFSFGVLEMAQALGDFQSLAHTDRRAMHVHLRRRDAELMRRVLRQLSQA